MEPKPWHWVVPETDSEELHKMACSLGVHRLTAASLMQRGVSTEAEARLFLQGSLNDLGDPFAMAGMEQAAGRLVQAVERREQILVYGDYDADGVTSTALLCRGLQNLGVVVEYYIPSRLGDGYGLHGHVLEAYAGRGGKLAVTVDCGINAFAEMKLAGELGLDLIVTDHHECFPGERAAFAVLNPKQPHCGYPERNLAGVGVAWTLLRALHRRLGVPFSETADYLDLVAVGSIADVVPLRGENRIIVRHGLMKLEKKPLPGLAALAGAAGMEGRQLTAMQVAFTLAPRLNAPGRLGDARPSVETLLADAGKADALAAGLNEKNILRQQVEKDILTQARELAAARSDDPALVLWHEDWHPGVVGIVAGRLASEYTRPVALIARDGDEGHGSIRSVPGCNVVEALSGCSEQLIRFGGHPEAAGLTLEASKLELFREAFCQAVEGQGMADYKVSVTAEAEPAELSLELVEELARLEPFGQGNPEPLFLLRDTTVVGSRTVGARSSHLQLRLQKGSPALAAICFGGGDREIPKGATVDAVVTPTANTWQGRTSLSLHVRDIRLSNECAASVTDARGGDKDKLLAGFVQNKRVLVWVNTRAAGDYLKKRFGPQLDITQLGRHIPDSPVDLVYFYHVPFDGKAVERLLGTIGFSGRPQVVLAYGGSDLLLNERIYAATIPCEKAMAKLARCLEQGGGPLTVPAAREALAVPVTAHLVAQAQAVFAEAGEGETHETAVVLNNLSRSRTYRENREALSAFRACQSFWWEATTGEISEYLKNPTEMTLPKGERQNEPATAKRAN